MINGNILSSKYIDVPADNISSCSTFSIRTVLIAGQT